MLLEENTPLKAGCGKYYSKKNTEITNNGKSTTLKVRWGERDEAENQ